MSVGNGSPGGSSDQRTLVSPLRLELSNERKVIAMNNVVAGAKVPMRRGRRGPQEDVFVTGPYKVLKADNSPGKYQSRIHEEPSRRYREWRDAIKKKDSP